MLPSVIFIFYIVDICCSRCSVITGSISGTSAYVKTFFVIFVDFFSSPNKLHFSRSEPSNSFINGILLKTVFSFSLNFDVNFYTVNKLVFFIYIYHLLY